MKLFRRKRKENESPVLEALEPAVLYDILEKDARFLHSQCPTKQTFNEKVALFEDKLLSNPLRIAAIQNKKYPLTPIILLFHNKDCAGLILKEYEVKGIERENYFKVHSYAYLTKNSAVAGYYREQEEGGERKRGEGPLPQEYVAIDILRRFGSGEEHNTKKALELLHTLLNQQWRSRLSRLSYENKKQIQEIEQSAKQTVTGKKTLAQLGDFLVDATTTYTSKKSISKLITENMHDNKYERHAKRIDDYIERSYTQYSSKIQNHFDKDLDDFLHHYFKKNPYKNLRGKK